MTTMNENLETEAAARFLAVAKLGRDEAGTFVRDGIGNAISYLDALAKAKSPSDLAAANIDLMKKSLGTVARGLEDLVGLAAKLAGPTAAPAR